MKDDARNETPVAFTAQYSVNTSLSTPNPFIYDDVIANMGEQYNEES